MKKKWKNSHELISLVQEDDTLSRCSNLKCLSYAPNIGYRSWIFSYKGTLVALYDAGNGHYDFHTTVSLVDLLAARLTIFAENIQFKIHTKKEIRK